MRYTQCPRGGNEGWLIKKTDRKFLPDTGDPSARIEVVLLPTRVCHHSECKQDHDRMTTAVYWEDEETGSHGWCCAVCGQILQWG